MNIIADQLAREIIVDELIGVGGRLRGEEVTILCPFHAERTPSCSVHVGHTVGLGVFHCFGCRKKGHYNEIAKILRLKQVETSSTINKSSNIDRLDVFKILASATDSQYKEAIKIRPVCKGLEPLPEDFEWRGLPYQFYYDLGAKFFWDIKTNSDYMYLPITMNQEYYGYTLCKTKGHGLKYLTFADADSCFLLFDKLPANGPIVLVEGHFDALRLYAEGIPAIAIMGVGNFGVIKKAALAGKNPTKIIICYDGDKPGHEAAQQHYKMLWSEFNVDIFYLPIMPNDKEKLDPGNMNREFLDLLYRKCYG